jgi:hypothetical protein
MNWAVATEPQASGRFGSTKRTTIDDGIGGARPEGSGLVGLGEGAGLWGLATGSPLSPI